MIDGSLLLHLYIREGAKDTEGAPSETGLGRILSQIPCREDLLLLLLKGVFSRKAVPVSRPALRVLRRMVCFKAAPGSANYGAAWTNLAACLPHYFAASSSTRSYASLHSPPLPPAFTIIPVFLPVDLLVAAIGTPFHTFLAYEIVDCSRSELRKNSAYRLVYPRRFRCSSELVTSVSWALV